MTLLSIRRGNPRDIVVRREGSRKGDAALNALACVASLLAAASIALAVGTFWSRPMWADEVLTIQVASAQSWSHLLAAVRLGLDATPPVYTGLGWTMLHLGLPPEWLPTALRSLNAVILSAAGVSLYGIGRVFLPRREAALAVAVFALLDVNRFAGLCLEIRTYALYFAVAVAAAHTGLRLLARPTAAMGLAHAACLCLLTLTHTIGVTFAVCLSGSIALVHVLHRDYRAAVCQALLMLPAVLAFLAWSSVIRSQAQLGSWIDPPGFYELMTTTFIYPASLAYMAAAGLVLLALAWRGRGLRSSLAVTASTLRRELGTDRRKAACLLFVGAFSAATLSAWVASRLLFPVFVMRYFTPNVLILFVLVVALIWSATTALRGPAGRRFVAGLVAVAAMVHVVGHGTLRQPLVSCYEPMQRRFFEDRVRSDLPLVIPQSLAWMSRVQRAGAAGLFPLDVPGPDGRMPPLRDHQLAFEASYMKNLAAWSGLSLFTDLDRLSRLGSGFLVLDYEGKGDWFVKLHGDPRFSSELVASETIAGDACRLWRVTAAR